MAAGVGVGLNFSDYFAIMPGVRFSMKGMKYEIVDEDITETSIEKYNYLEIPILFKIAIPTKSPLIPNFYIGPVLSFNLSARYIEKENGESYEEKTKKYTERFDFGLDMGGGTDIKAGPGRIIINIRYTLGFLTIVKKPYFEGEDAKKSNNVFSILAGYGFDFGK
jgi:hypothetical protein